MTETMTEPADETEATRLSFSDRPHFRLRSDKDKKAFSTTTRSPSKQSVLAGSSGQGCLLHDQQRELAPRERVGRRRKEEAHGLHFLAGALSLPLRNGSNRRAERLGELGKIRKAWVHPGCGSASGGGGEDKELHLSVRVKSYYIYTYIYIITVWRRPLPVSPLRLAEVT